MNGEGPLTGTIAIGKPRVAPVATTGHLDESRVLRLASGVEQFSSHPLARTLVDEASRGLRRQDQAGDAGHLRAPGGSWSAPDNSPLGVDRAANVREVSSAVGIDGARGDLLPLDNADAVRKLMVEGESVLMLGDGTNDAPALSAATLGVALASQGRGIATELTSQ